MRHTHTYTYLSCITPTPTATVSRHPSVNSATAAWAGRASAPPSCACWCPPCEAALVPLSPPHRSLCLTPATPSAREGKAGNGNLDPAPPGFSWEGIQALARPAYYKVLHRLWSAPPARSLTHVPDPTPRAVHKVRADLPAKIELKVRYRPLPASLSLHSLTPFSPPPLSPRCATGRCPPPAWWGRSSRAKSWKCTRSWATGCRYGRPARKHPHPLLHALLSHDACVSRGCSTRPQLSATYACAAVTTRV